MNDHADDALLFSLRPTEIRLCLGIFLVNGLDLRLKLELLAFDCLVVGGDMRVELFLELL